MTREQDRNPHMDIISKKRCSIHPNCYEGGCGFYLGKEHSWVPDSPKIIAIQMGFNDKMERSKVVIYSNRLIDRLYEREI